MQDTFLKIIFQRDGLARLNYFCFDGSCDAASSKVPPKTSSKKSHKIRLKARAYFLVVGFYQGSIFKAV